ncbi:15302_t:CDS:2, partial [Funneliformis geosporum]
MVYRIKIFYLADPQKYIRARNAEHDLQNLRIQSKHNNQMFRQALNNKRETRKVATEIGRIGAGITTVTSNVRGSLPAITIAPGIKLDQLLYLFRTTYTAVKYLKQMAVFGQLIQGNMSVEQFSTRIKKI